MPSAVVIVQGCIPGREGSALAGPATIAIPPNVAIAAIAQARLRIDDVIRFALRYMAAAFCA